MKKLFPVIAIASFCVVGAARADSYYDNFYQQQAMQMEIGRQRQEAFLQQQEMEQQQRKHEEEMQEIRTKMHEQEIESMRREREVDSNGLRFDSYK